MMAQPGYFETIRKAAAKRWEQLEEDPELAAPWHLLFKQVQSPRHVLSELLQNADDAGATETSVRVEDGAFIFTHNGGDFIEEHFASLCRFGYSNKRALHTIGFRGIGFKSTFSLGDKVELHTPTLSVAFDRHRFTQPHWIPADSGARLTEIRVRLGDEHRETAIRKNLDDWLRSPLSLLFFKHIRRMKIGGEELHWKKAGPGPVPRSDWMALNGKADQTYLIARSAAAPFPQDCLDEIRQERQVSEEQLSDFPPCTVDIVFGAKGQLFVVLPTGVETALPFACNAPFIQDSSRLKIKDPEISPTNRWLLDRIGKLAAAVMLEWLGQGGMTVAERSRAYGALPDVDREDNRLEGTCATIVELAFGEGINGQPCLLTGDGALLGSNEAVIIPHDLLDVWTSEQITAFLDKGNRPPFSHFVSHRDVEKLVHWSLIERIGKPEVLAALQAKHLPRPESWRRLLKLWAYIAPDVTGYNWQLNKKALRIVPAQGKDVLYSANEVVRLGEKRLLQSDEDWEFLGNHLLVLNQNWPRFLAEQRRAAEDAGSDTDKKDVAAGLGVLNTIGLNDASDANVVIEQVAAGFFKQESIQLADCVRLAQIAAKLGAAAGASFRFATQDRHLRATDKALLSDPNGALEAILPKEWCSSHVLHPDYEASFLACTKDEWRRWVESGRAGLLGLVPFVQTRSNIWNKKNFEAELRRRSCDSAPAYAYRTGHFVIEDWDFEEIHWKHWTALAKNDPSIWGQVVERLLAQPDSFWTRGKTARGLHVASNGSTRSIVSDPILPSWVMRLRELPCLPDTRSFYHNPEALLLRTPETEPLLDVELFVHARLDREASRPLLKLLGARDTPMGPGRLLDCLRALSKAEKPPIHEVEKWYRRLDQLVDTCSTADLTNIRNAFRTEKIVLTENVSWTTAAGVFLASGDDDVPGAEIIRRSVQDLALWGKIDIAPRPTVELALAWLKQLPSRTVLNQNDARRVKALLARHALQIWNECGHWLNLAGEWAPVATLSYGLSMQSLIRWSHLHEWVKQKTADLQLLPMEVTGLAPFALLPSLSSHIEEQFEVAPRLSGIAQHPAWLRELGFQLQRIDLENEEEGAQIRSLGRDLAETAWQVSDDLELVPYIDGAPAGLPRSADVIWRDRMFYVIDRPHARLARSVSQELGRAFGRQDIGDAVKLCFDRSAEFVTEYMEENFTLAAAEAIEERVMVAQVPESSANGAVAVPPRSLSGAESADEQDGTVHPSDAAVQTEVESDEQREEESIPATPSEQAQPSAPTKPHHERASSRPAKLSIIERFARANGFEKDGDDRFFHTDGSWIAKQQGERFWERRTGSGELLRYYWPKDQCLQSEPLQLEADIWGLIDKNPDTYALVLSDAQDRAVEITGGSLRSMCNAGQIKLYPATYRLVYQDARE